METTLVPYITNLAEDSLKLSKDASTAHDAISTRTRWKIYLRNVLPHAEKGIRSFMLACLADGHSFEDDEEGRAKGPSVVCPLSLHDVHQAVLLRTDRRNETETNGAKLVTQAAKQAVDLAKLHLKAKGSSVQASAQVAARHVKVPPAPSEDDDEIQAASAKSVKFTNRDAWIPRYTQWAYDVFKDAKTDTPTEAQREVLLTVHFRAVKEEYEFLGEPVPQEVWHDLPTTCNISKPLLRLIHGLPGSGKSK